MVTIKLPGTLLQWVESAPVGKSKSEKIRALLVYALSSLHRLGLKPDAEASGNGSTDGYVRRTVLIPAPVDETARKLVEDGFFLSCSEALRNFSLIGATRLMRQIYADGEE
ncbi:MAG: hypothetical protein QXP74_00205 [Nitrososphaerota archaeon]